MHDVFALPLVDSLPARAGTATTVYAALLDANGTAVPSTVLEWSVGAGSGSVDSFRTHEFSTSGWHTNIWRSDPAPGVQALTAAESGNPGVAVTVHFRVMSNPDAITESVVGPASFTVQLQQAVPQPLQVVALGPTGAPLPAANLLFYAPDDVALSAAPGTAVAVASPGSPSGARISVVANAQGEAAVTVKAGTKAGDRPIAATVRVLNGAAGNARWNLNVSPGPAANITQSSGDNQAGHVGVTLPQPLVAWVSDAFGNPVPGVNVTWGATSGGGSVSPSVSPTDSGGHASTTWTLGATVGTQTAAAALPSGTSVTFTAGASP
jgi:hypothetical protein